MYKDDVYALFECVLVLIKYNKGKVAKMAKMSNGEFILRKLLFLRHGCSIPDLYGDDGELQCNKCMIDFKRDSAELIEKKFHEIAINSLTKDKDQRKILKAAISEQK